MNIQLFNFKPTHSLSQFEFVNKPNSSESQLGDGAFGVVRLAKEKKTGTLYALKSVNINPKTIARGDLILLKQEVDIHQKLDHPNIVKFHGYIQEGGAVYLVLDYAENGNLFFHIQRSKDMSEKEIHRLFRQTCEAIQYLHDNKVIHRDIKPENILLDKDFNVKVCDFGWAAYRTAEKKKTLCGTYEYLAPEIVKGERYDYHVDIWALGILLFELFHNKAPYSGYSVLDLKRSILNSEIVFKETIPNDAKELILNILQKNPSSRFSIANILEHSWMKSHHELQAKKLPVILIGSIDCISNEAATEIGSAANVDLLDLNKIMTKDIRSADCSPISMSTDLVISTKKASESSSNNDYALNLKPTDKVSSSFLSVDSPASSSQTSRRKIFGNEKLPSSFISSLSKVMKELNMISPTNQHTKRSNTSLGSLAELDVPSDDKQSQIIVNSSLCFTPSKAGRSVLLN